MKSNALASILLIVLCEYVLYSDCQTKFDINEPSVLETHNMNTFIINLKKNDNYKKKIVLRCFGGPNSLDLNLTFTSTTTKTLRVLNN